MISTRRLLVEFLSFLTFQTSWVQNILKRSGIILYILYNSLNLRNPIYKGCSFKKCFWSQTNDHKWSDRILLLLRKMLQSINCRLFYVKKLNTSTKNINFVSYCSIVTSCVYPASKVLIKWKLNAACTWIDLHPLFYFLLLFKLFITYLSGKRYRVT